MTAPLCVLSRCDKRQKPCRGRGACACGVDGHQIEEHEAADYCPHPDGPKFGTAKYPLDWESRGAGDTLAKVINFVTLGMVKPCGGCGERQDALNAAAPY